MRYTSILLALLVTPLLAAGHENTAPQEQQQYTGKDATLEAQLTELKAKSDNGDIAATKRVYAQYAQNGQDAVAKAWFQKYMQQKEALANAGDVQHLRELGMLYLHGDVYVQSSPQQAVTLLSKASELGDAVSSVLLGEYFKPFSPEESNRFYEKAYSIYKEQATQDSTEQKNKALEMMGYMEQEGLGTQKDATAGIAHLEQAATPWAYERLFQTYANGIGVTPDMPKALSYARKIADTAAPPHNAAQAAPNAGQMAWLLADSYLNGKNGVTKDEALGEHYLDIADALNIRNAIYCKGLRLKNKNNNKEAFICFNRAASMKMPEAMTYVGIMKLHGAPGIEQDTERGLAMLEAVASYFSEGKDWYVGRAPYELALYYESIGNKELADNWYRIASDRNVIEAMAHRGLCHIIPTSELEWSPTLMYRWWKIGSDAGDATCSRYLNIFLWGVIPVLLIIVFGLPIIIVHILNKRARRQEDEDATTNDNE